MRILPPRSLPRLAIKYNACKFKGRQDDMMPERKEKLTEDSFTDIIYLRHPPDWGLTSCWRMNQRKESKNNSPTGNSKINNNKSKIGGKKRNNKNNKHIKPMNLQFEDDNLTNPHLGKDSSNPLSSSPTPPSESDEDLEKFHPLAKAASGISPNSSSRFWSYFQKPEVRLVSASVVIAVLAIGVNLVNRAIVSGVGREAAIHPM